MECTCSIRQLEVLEPATHGVPRRSTKAVRVAGVLASPPERQAPVASEPLPEICSPTAYGESGILSEDPDDFKESRGAGARSCGGSRPARKEREDCKTNDGSVPLPIPSQHGWFLDCDSTDRAGRPSDVSKRKIGRVASGAKGCENPPQRDKMTRLLSDRHTSSDRRRRKSRAARSKDCLL